MKGGLVIVCYLMTWLLTARCWSISEDGPLVTQTADTSKIFAETLKKFQNKGFIINMDVSTVDLEEMWKPYLKYHSEPIEAMYVFLGAETPQKPYRNISDNCWLMDMEAIEGVGSYKRILDNIERISKGDLRFRDIQDYCNDNDDGKAWVNFTFEGNEFSWQLAVNDDWADPQLFQNIQDLCRKFDKKGRLTFFPAGQAFVVSYLTEEQFVHMKELLGPKFKWLDIRDGRF
jgi:hypothetical protein